jgi:hypothetical protein
MKHHIAALLLAVVFVAAWARAEGFKLAEVQQNGLSKMQAEQILQLVIARSAYRKWLHSSNAYIENLDEPAKQAVPGFFMFRLAYDAPTAGATAYAGPYLISQKTADVWDVSLPTACKNLHFPALTRLQAGVMKETGATVQDESALRKAFDCFD